MIEVHVMGDRSAAEGFLCENNIPADSVVLAASEDGRTVGFVAFDCAASRVILRAVTAEDDDVCELLLRAAFSYGERRGVSTVISQFDTPRAVLTRLGFSLFDGQLTAEVNNVVHMCRNCAADGK